jgi:hypothetical protein
MSMIEYLDFDCRHCGKAASMQVVGTHDEVREVHDDEDPFNDSYHEGLVYTMCVCPSCHKITVVEEEVNSRASPSHLGKSIIFPQPARIPDGLPSSVERAFAEASSVRTVNPNAYAVLLGRVLDKVCQDRNVEGENLNSKIRILADRGEIPKPLSEIAHSLRQLRNVGAHADLGDLTADEIPLLDDLCRAILEYVYTARQLLARVQEHLSRLDERRKRGEH